MEGLSQVWVLGHGSQQDLGTAPDSRLTSGRRQDGTGLPQALVKSRKYTKRGVARQTTLGETGTRFVCSLINVPLEAIVFVSIELHVLITSKAVLFSLTTLLLEQVWASQVAQTVKCLPAMREIPV